MSQGRLSRIRRPLASCCYSSDRPRSEPLTQHASRPPRRSAVSRALLPSLTLLFALAAPMVLAAPVAAQDAPQPQPGEPRCGWCSTTGKLSFEVHNKWSLEHAGGEGWSVQYCSEAIASENMALDWEPCVRCKTPSLKLRADNMYAGIVKRNEDWLAERRRVDTTVRTGKKPMVHVQTTHFVIGWDVPKISVKKKSLKAHEAAHLYAEKLEELYTRMHEMFGTVDKEFLRSLHYVYIFAKPSQAHLAGPAYTGLQGLPTVKRSGGANHESVIVSWWDKSEYPKHEDMLRHQIHQVVHQYTSAYYYMYWFKPGEFGLTPPWLNDKYGWLDAGLAHWFEMDFDGKAATFCFREQDSNARWGGGDWHKNVYKAVVGEDTPSFAEAVSKPAHALTPREHQFAWSWVDYLMTLDAEDENTLRMGKALKLAKHKAATRDILKEAFGMSMLAFEDRWRQFVKDEYKPNSKR